MESSRRAVEAYKRTHLVDFVVTDDDKVAPLYRLDEICDMLQTSSSDMVREVVEYTMKRLGSKSPRVKQKTLRMIKYVVVKGGPEFKHQMQRQAAAIRQLFEYKGQLDVLKGDALNKAVRDTAHEVISAIFASDEKSSQAEELNKRIMGFGSTNYDMHAATDLKKPSLIDVANNVLEFGSSSIKQGLTIISGYSGANNGNMRNESGSYWGPGLKKSLTSERGTPDKFDLGERGDVRDSPEGLGGHLGPDVHNSRTSQHDSMGARADTDTNRAGLSLEERLLDNITAAGGMRLQPTRESLQKFLGSVIKLDQTNLCHALESKLQSPAWQVRFKTLCILEAIMRQQDQDYFRAVVDYFEENAAAIQDCLQLPQTTLRDKAVKILDHLGVFSKDSEGLIEPKDAPQQPNVAYDIPDLIDTGELDLLAEEKKENHTSLVRDGISNTNVTTGDLLGNGLWTGQTEASVETGSDDVFVGLSFHTPEGGPDNSSEGLFSGLSLTNSSAEGGSFDVFINGTHNNEKPAMVNPWASTDSLVDLLGSSALTNSGKDAPPVRQAGPQSSPLQTTHHENLALLQMFGNLSNVQGTPVNFSSFNPQMAHVPMGMFANYQAPMLMPCSYIPGLPGDAVLQQQLSKGMGGFQGLNMSMNGMNGGNLQGLSVCGGVRGDHFDFSGDASSRLTAALDTGKRENSKAFDFISDHVSAARTPKRSA